MNALKTKILLLLVRLMRRATSTESPLKILVVSTTGFGDTLWATPALRAIKASYPHAFLGVLTSPIGASILSDNPHIDELFLLPRKITALLKLVRKLKQQRFTTALIFHVSQRITLPLCSLANIPQIIGTESINKGLDALLTTKLPKTSQHEISRRLAIVKQMGAQEQGMHLEIYPSQKDTLYAKELLGAAKGPIIVLHPGAKDRFKQWAPEAFTFVGQRLIDELNATIVLTGSKEEKTLTSSIASSLTNAFDVAGTLSVKQLAALLASSDLMITNDTGPMHLAFAMHTKTICLFSPTDPKICGPLDVSHTLALYQPAACTPCLGKKCLDAFCMLQHSPELVVSHALHFLKQGNLAT